MATSFSMNSLMCPMLLEKVDKLRDLTIGHQVSLPQLVVVGDQSSGKSSLLESLTGIPFPRSQTLCTRHATQITSRRDEDEYVIVAIIPGGSASEDHKKDLEKFKKRLPSIAEFKEKFRRILDKASEIMGLRANLKIESGAVFSEDVLKIEMHGPNQDFLTIIDVPGIFRDTSDGTSLEDMTTVRTMVKRYIKNGRTVILAVLPCNVDSATQEILQLAEKYDKKGERTIGVLTKPDLTTEGSRQAQVCNLMRGKKRPLSLGYYLVRNRGEDNDARTPDQLDQSLRTEPWSTLPQDRVGIASLKEQLGSLLLEITNREFPGLIRDIQDKIQEHKQDLDSLGPPRSEEREQRRFLSSIASDFQDRTRAALAADYNSHRCFDEQELRLSTHIMNITEVFGHDCALWAHSRNFAKIGIDSVPEAMAATPTSEDFERTEEDVVDRLRSLLEEIRIDDVTPQEQRELRDILEVRGEVVPPSSNVKTWIEEVHLRSRGLVLGTFNPALVSLAFAEQSQKWRSLTAAYMNRIFVTLHRFMAATLRSVCSDENIRSKIWCTMLDAVVERYKKGAAQAKLLVHIEQHSQPYTLNRRFARTLSSLRASRIAELLIPCARRDGKTFGDTQYMVTVDDILRAIGDLSNLEQLEEAIHDILHAYYSIALDRFLDNIFKQAVDYCLLHGPQSPLKVFNEDWVLSLETEELARIAGETVMTKRHRGNLNKKIKDLTEALNILKKE